MTTSELTFTPSKPLTLGVEIEIQLLDQHTLDLTPKSPEVLALAEKESDRIKAEIFQSMLEINTGICEDAHQVHTDLSESIDLVSKIAQGLGLRIASTGTHPFAHYSDRIIFPAARYMDLIDRNQWIARRLMIFGMHVHIGMKDGDHAIQMNNALLHYLPILLAISASSPFWQGRDTELASSRITFFEALPTGGHPCSINSWSEFTSLYNKLIFSNSIRSPKDIWWDIRPSPAYGTLEIRICDGLATLAETTAVTALIHALSIYIDKQIQSGRRFAAPPDWIMRENKWRASRWGVDAKIIFNDQGENVTLRSFVEDLLIELQPISQEKKYGDYFALITDLLFKGPSYKRQRLISEKSNTDLKLITDFAAREFTARMPLWY